MRTTYCMSNIKEYESLDMENVDDLREQQETLPTNINSMEKQNLELKNLLKRETESNQTSNKVSEENSRGVQNIYISNCHCKSSCNCGKEKRYNHVRMVKMETV